MIIQIATANPSSIKSLGHYVTSKMKTKKKRKEDSDFWFNENPLKDILTRVKKKIDKSLDSFPKAEIKKGGRESYRRRAAL